MAAWLRAKTPSLEQLRIRDDAFEMHHLRHQCGWTLDHIAEWFGVSRETVRKRLFEIWWHTLGSSCRPVYSRAHLAKPIIVVDELELGVGNGD